MLTATDRGQTPAGRNKPGPKPGGEIGLEASSSNQQEHACRVGPRRAARPFRLPARFEDGARTIARFTRHGHRCRRGGGFFSMSLSPNIHLGAREIIARN
jgi:hypothetical protein